MATATPDTPLAVGTSGAPGPVPFEGAPAGDRHRGSKSARLSGGSVVGAWVGSIVFHVALFLPMLLLVLPFSAETAQPDLPLTHVELTGSVDSNAAPTPTPSKLPTHADELALETPPLPVPERFVPPADSTQAKKPDLAIVGIGVGGGDADRFALRIGGATAPRFFGVGGQAHAARTVVYVVDMSASMQDTFGIVRQELRRSISSLKRSQKFHVIFFNGMTPLENSPRKLVSAIDAQREQFFEFLSRIEPSGSTEPSEAMRLAIGLHPDLVFLLSDGEDFPPRLLEELDGWNRDRRVRISTIAYLNPMGRRVLEAIAREHRGEFKFVSDDDLP